MQQPDSTAANQQIQQKGRTLIDLNQLEDESWIATQLDIDIEGSGETAALALMDYCRQVAPQNDSPGTNDP
jgi:hypothetical protein